MKIEDMNLGTAAQPVGVAMLNPANITGLADCIEDARLAALDRDSGPAEPLSYNPLLGRIEAVRRKFPPLYRHTMVTPFLETLRQIGAQAFHDILARDPERQALGGLMMDIAQAILQQGEGFAETATDAFEEVVSDLYDGFLSAEDRQGVKLPDLGAIPPLVKWGHADFGPYTWPVDATSVFGCQAAVVNPPPANSRKGLVAWSALGHETAGHDILHADTGLEGEFSYALQQNLRPLGHDLDAYWLTFLKTMHDQNPSWGPLFVAHPGNITRHLTYCRALDTPETIPARIASRSIRPSKRSVSPPKRSRTRAGRRHAR